MDMLISILRPAQSQGRSGRVGERLSVPGSGRPLFGSQKGFQLQAETLNEQGIFMFLRRLGQESRQMCSPGPTAHRFLKQRMATRSRLRRRGREKPISCRTSNHNTGGFMMHPSTSPRSTQSPFGAAWRWSPARSTPRLQCSGGCGCSNPPFRPTVPGSSRRQPAPGAHWHRKPSIEPRTVALWARCIAPFFVLDENGVLPRNRCKFSVVDRRTKGIGMSFFNVFIGDGRGQLAIRSPVGRREL